jgi:hypothetical protein
LYEAGILTLPRKENIMSKNQNVKKDSKKEPAKTMKEKKAAKREKKNEKLNHATLTP